MSALPSTNEQWAALWALLVGGLVGSVTRPLLWPIGPLRWSAFLTAAARQESEDNPDAYNPSDMDGTPSVGILQFHQGTPEMLGWTLDDAKSPYTSGVMAAALVSNAIARRPFPWLLLWVPLVGYPMFRWLWTHGYATSSAWNIPGACLVGYGLLSESSGGEPRGAMTFVVVRMGTLAPLVAALVPVAERVLERRR